MLYVLFIVLAVLFIIIGFCITLGGINVKTSLSWVGGVMLIMSAILLLFIILIRLI